MDRKWWHEYGGKVDAEMEMWTGSREAARIYGLNFVPSEPGGGISERNDRVRQGGSSGFLAMSLALHFGAKKVVLLGYDMQAKDGKLHWHADHGPKLGNPVPDRMKKWVEWFNQVGKATDTVVNATRESALKCFPSFDLKDL